MVVTDRGAELLTVPLMTNERRRSSCKLNISPVSIQARLSAAQADAGSWQKHEAPDNHWKRHEKWLSSECAQWTYMVAYTCLRNNGLSSSGVLSQQPRADDSYNTWLTILQYNNNCNKMTKKVIDSGVIKRKIQFVFVSNERVLNPIFFLNSSFSITSYSRILILLAFADWITKILFPKRFENTTIEPFYSKQLYMFTYNVVELILVFYFTFSRYTFEMLENIVHYMYTFYLPMIYEGDITYDCIRTTTTNISCIFLIWFSFCKNDILDLIYE